MAFHSWPYVATPGYWLRSAHGDDIPGITDLVINVMSEDVFDQQLFPVDDKTDRDQQASNRRDWMLALWSRQLNNKQAQLLVAYPPGSIATIAGFACWHYAEPESAAGAEDNVMMEALGDTTPQGMSGALYREATEEFQKAKKAALDTSRACYHLMMIATSPDHISKGIGTLLFEWAKTRADAEGALIYLEATTSGLPLYKKFGCKQVAEAKFSAGGERVMMLREPRKWL